MKTSTLIAIVLLSVCTLSAAAKVFTVSNNPGLGGQYTTVQAAIDAANVGDTIYVSGSANTYDQVTLNKRITLIGAGYSLTGTQYNMGTTIPTITIDSAAFSSNPIYGAQIIGVNAYIVANKPIKNIHISRCYCSAISYVANGWVIENNVIGSISFYTPTYSITGTVVRNNFFTGDLSGYYQENGTGLLIDHNIIQGKISSLSYALITNNIFYFANVSASYNCTFNIFNNNITIYGSADALPFGNNSGTGNHNNESPSNIFSNGLVAPAAFPALTGYDWHVKATSHGHLTATDGSDIGIYGGSKSMPNFTGASTIPQMTLLNINNSSILEGGTLNFSFKARKQN